MRCDARLLCVGGCESAVRAGPVGGPPTLVAAAPPTSAIATAIALAKRSAGRLIEEVEVPRVDGDRHLVARASAARAAGTMQRGSGREPTTVSGVPSLARTASSSAASLLICLASTLKYAIDSPPSDSTISTVAWICGRSSRPWAGCRSPARRPTITGRPPYSRRRGYCWSASRRDRDHVAAEIDGHARR